MLGSGLSMPERLAAARWSIPEFARLLGVEPHPGQVRFWHELIQRDETRWRPLWMTLCLSSGNRAGKTLTIAIALLHHAYFKFNLREPDLRDERELLAWNRAPYHWYHFGIQQEVGELVYWDIANLLDGTHPAQKRKGCPLTEVMGPVATTDTKERGEYRWVRFDPLFGGAEIHFRTTNEKALGSLGKDMNGISYDECAFDSNLTFVINEVLHLRRLATGGPLLLISTPSEGFTQFADEWHRGDIENPDRDPDRISLRMSTRENIGYGIDRAIFDRLVAGFPPALVPQNIDGHFLEGRHAFFDHAAVDASFSPAFPDDAPRQADQTYVHGIDPALTYDSTWSIVLRTAGGKAIGVRASRRKGKQTMVNVVAMITTDHALYHDPSIRSHCISALDTSGMGGKVFREALAHIEGLRSVEFGGTKSRKLKMLTDLKGLVEQGRLRFPREGVWLELRRQLLGYRLDDRGLANTDGVMALAIAAKQMLMRPEESLDEAPFVFFEQEPPEVEEGYEDAARAVTDIDRLFSQRGSVTSRLLH